MSIYQFGTLVFIPGEGELRQIADQLRIEFDPQSAIACPAHVTVSQPFAFKPTQADMFNISSLLEKFESFEIQVGPAIASPNNQLIWFDVSAKKAILSIREKLHQTGLFRTELPLTNGFIPHLTISEMTRSSEEVKAILMDLNNKYSSWKIKFDSVSWIIPNEKSIFEVHRTLQLG